MINIDFLEYIVEFSRTENLTKASEKLHITQSALTRAMQKIEGEVGVPLFSRSKNKLALNDTGREFVKHAQTVLDAEREMIDATRAFHNSYTVISIGLTAPGPLLKYGPRLYSVFPEKAISAKIGKSEDLLKGLSDGIYDFVFLNDEILTEDVISIFAFTEKLFVSVPKTHPIANNAEGVGFSEIDGQSFLIADELGVWGEMINKHLPNSKFFAQDLENLTEIVNASTIPSFSTNVTINMQTDVDRVNVPVVDEIAAVDFYVAFRKKNRSKLSRLLQIISSGK